MVYQALTVVQQDGMYGWGSEIRLVWSPVQWQTYLVENKLAYESGELGVDAFWYYFGVWLGMRAGTLSVDELKILLPKCLINYYQEINKDGES